MTHALKTWPTYYQAIRKGDKTFELRKNDRDFKVGDRLLLQEYDPNTKKYTGDEWSYYVTFVLDGFGLKAGYVCLGIKEIDIQ